MRTILILCLFLCSSSLLAQVSDDFSDGDFTHNPRWEGDSLCFEVNSAKQLHLKTAGSDTSCLATATSRMNDTEWNFWLKLSFNTSKNNYARVYLAASNQELNQPLDGYFIRVGGGDDSICFMRQSGTEIYPLFCFPDYLTSQSTNVLRCKIFRSKTGIWTAWLDANGGTDFMEQGSVSDNTIQQCSWFGLFYKYTSSNATKFYFDDLYVGPLIRDTIPPVLKTLEIQDDRNMILNFSESLEVVSAQTCSNFMILSGMKYPENATLISGQPNQVGLTFSEPLPNNISDTLYVKNLFDLEGNKMRDTLVPFALFEPAAYDILIHEIMCDPEPVVGLPASEYVELYNKTELPVNLAGWVFDYGNNRKIFPSVTIPSHGYLLLTKDTTLTTYGAFLPLFTSGSSLTNGGTRLTLRNSRNQIIHSVLYSSKWYENSWKEDGGWSLEMIDSGNPCGCGENWKASTDAAGGTPGRENSIKSSNPDLIPPVVIRSFFFNLNTWEIRLSEPIDTTVTGAPEEWLLEPGEVHPDTIFPAGPAYTALRLVFADPFSTGIIYTLSGSAPLADCAGNILTDGIQTASAIPETIDRNDVIINEILSDPYPQSSRFIELLNRSEKVIDLRELAILSADTDSTFSLTDAKLLTADPYLMFPFDHVAICAEEKEVKSQYDTPNPNQFLEPLSFPSLKNDEGHLMLIRTWDEELIERVSYQKEMHYPLLYSTEGVSLERIHPDRSSRDPSNWHSAAESAGFATPACQNSQWLNVAQTDDEVTIVPPIFSPDNDGHDDVVVIQYKLDSNGTQATVVIYDTRGRMVRQLVSNFLAGQTGEFFWDGMTDDNRKVSTGIYIVYLELLNPSGEVKKFKKPVVVAGNL